MDPMRGHYGDVYTHQKAPLTKWSEKYYMQMQMMPIDKFVTYHHTHKESHDHSLC